MHLHINADTAETRRVQIVLAAIAERIEEALGARLLAHPDKLLKTLTFARR